MASASSPPSQVLPDHQRQRALRPGVPDERRRGHGQQERGEGQGLALSVGPGSGSQDGGGRQTEDNRSRYDVLRRRQGIPRAHVGRPAAELVAGRERHLGDPDERGERGASPRQGEDPGARPVGARPEREEQDGERDQASGQEEGDVGQRPRKAEEGGRPRVVRLHGRRQSCVARRADREGQRPAHRVAVGRHHPPQDHQRAVADRAVEADGELRSRCRDRGGDDHAPGVHHLGGVGNGRHRLGEGERDGTGSGLEHSALGRVGADERGVGGGGCGRPQQEDG
jgi:hypothetical protein